MRISRRVRPEVRKNFALCLFASVHYCQINADMSKSSF